MAKKVIAANGGHVPNFQADLSKSRKVAAFSFRPRVGSALADLLGNSGKVGCQNVVLALEDVDMKYAGQGRFDHQGDHTRGNCAVSRNG